MKKVMTVSMPVATLRTGNRTPVAIANNCICSSPTARLPLTCPDFFPAHVFLRGIHIACALGVCSSAQCKDDEASDNTDLRHEHAHAPKLKSVPEWFEQKRLKNYTKFQAQTARANFCSFPIENIKGAQNETRSSSPRTCGFKPPADIFPTAERPDNRMKKRLMTKPRRGRAKEHGAIPAKEHITSTISWLHQVGIRKTNAYKAF